jgi:hypothetical protein
MVAALVAVALVARSVKSRVQARDAAGTTDGAPVGKMAWSASPDPTPPAGDEPIRLDRDQEQLASTRTAT